MERLTIAYRGREVEVELSNLRWRPLPDGEWRTAATREEVAKHATAWVLEPFSGGGAAPTAPRPR